MKPLALTIVALCLASSAHAQAPHRFGFDCDGNWWDTDDRGGAAISLHIVRNSGQNARLVYYGVNNHSPESKPAWERAMRDSTIDGDWSHPALVDCRLHGRAAAVSKLRAVLAASTPANTYWHGMQGPPDIFYEAHRGVSTTALQNVKLTSHSAKYNEQTGGQRSWDDIRFVQKERIPNGNDKLNTKQNWAPWSGWMHPFDYRRLRAVGRADCSDATVAGYLVHGKRQTTINDLKLWIGN